MEARDNVFSIVMIGIMVISAFVLTYKW
ncbi:MAG: hypothetical protein C5S41_04225, partial [Candidatus Methanomarinus sp.]